LLLTFWPLSVRSLMACPTEGADKVVMSVIRLPFNELLPIGRWL
jgi:hypothetical protein